MALQRAEYRTSCSGCQSCCVVSRRERKLTPDFLTKLASEWRRAFSCHFLLTRDNHCAIICHKGVDSRLRRGVVAW